jgi:hypothetical protein
MNAADFAVALSLSVCDLIAAAGNLGENQIAAAAAAGNLGENQIAAAQELAAALRCRPSCLTVVVVFQVEEAWRCPR